MLRHFILIIMLLFAASNAVTTVIDLDTLKANREWGDTIIITKPLVVYENYTLTIKPGSVVLFRPAAKLEIYGNLLAVGTETDSILFSASDTVAGWGGILFQVFRLGVPNLSKLRFITLQYAKCGSSFGPIFADGYDGVQLSDSRIHRNSVGQNGCIVTISKLKGPLERCTFTYNHCSNGGAVFKTYGSNVLNCSFVKNSVLGAGIILQIISHYPNTSKVINCLIAENTAATADGCLSLNSMDLINCTVINNTSTTRCFSIRFGSVINSIFWNNSPSNTIDTGMTTFKNCLIGKDPGLTSIALGDFTPAVRSASLDLGTTDTTGLQLPAVDLAGQKRISCGTIDIGAFERPSLNNCPPRAIDTVASISPLWSIPLVIDTSVFSIYDFDENPLQFIIDPAEGCTVRGDTIFIDSGRTWPIRTTVRATDGTDTTRVLKLNVYPQINPEITQVHEQKIRNYEQLIVNLKVAEAVDPDNSPGKVRIIAHAGEHYTVQDSVIIPDISFFGDLAVPIHATDGRYSSDTVILIVHVVANITPVLFDIKPIEISQWRNCQLTLRDLVYRDDDDAYPSIIIATGEHYALRGTIITPDSSFIGTLSIPVRITDGHDTSGSLPLLLTVTKGNRPPVISAVDDANYYTCNNIDITLNDHILAYDLDNDSLTLRLFPNKGYSINGTRVIPDSCGGILKVIVAVTDGIATSAKDTLTVYISTIDTTLDTFSIPQSRPLSQYGKLRVKNGALCNRDGFPVQLKGMSSHGLQWYGRYMNRKSIEWLASDWHASVVRAAMYTDQGGYLSDKKLEIKRKVKEIAGYAKAAGIYCIIDWHILYDNDPNTSKREAIDFFREMAMTYKNQDHILYEICNEPNGTDVGWNSHVRPYADELIRTIRMYDSTGVILVGSSTWSQDVDSVAQNPLPYNNIAYTFHFYAGTHGDTLKAKLHTALDSGLAIFVSEWGTSTSNGDGGAFLTESTSWLRLLDSANISWCNWSLSNNSETSAALRSRADTLGAWPDSVLTISGRYARECIRGDQINDPPILMPVHDDTIHKGDHFTIRLRAFDQDLYQNLTWTITGIADGMTIDSSGTVHWNADIAGTHTITVTVKDDSGSSASTTFSLFVDVPLQVENHSAEFQVVKMTPVKGFLLFRFNPSEPTSYRLRIYSVNGRVVDEISGIVMPQSNINHSLESLKVRLHPAGVYLIEFIQEGHKGRIDKTYTRITGVGY